MTDSTPDISPLTSVDPDFLKHIFAPSTDPLTLPDTTIDQMVHEVRRRRSAFLAAEAAQQSKGKRAKPTTTAAAQAALDKPVGEVSLDDLEGPQ